MELFNSLKDRLETYDKPFTHWAVNKPLTDLAIKEICNAEIANPVSEGINYDGTRAIDGGEGKFREGIKSGGKAKKYRCFVTKENSKNFPELTSFIKELCSKTVPYNDNYGYFFSSGPNTWHGMEKKEIKKERRCIQINYVTFETDWKVK